LRSNKTSQTSESSREGPHVDLEDAAFFLVYCCCCCCCCCMATK